MVAIQLISQLLPVTFTHTFEPLITSVRTVPGTVQLSFTFASIVMAVWNLSHPRHYTLIRLIPLTSWLLITSGNAQAPTNWDTFPFNPPSLPLAVKNPYLNAWAPLAGNSLAINQAWPRSYLPLIKVSLTIP